MNVTAREDLLDLVSSYVGSRLGLHFPKERSGSLQRGLERAAADFGLPDVASCARWLLSSPLSKHQIEVLASHLTVGETYFFRDRKLFEYLEKTILPARIRQGRKAGRRLRIWSAGCATGEEPYSIAILLRKLIRDIENWNIALLATDINPVALAKAVKGIYGNWSFREVPARVKTVYFEEIEAGRYALHPEFRKLVTFSCHNLFEDPYPSLTNNTNAMDIIICRNVLMYFAPDRQREVVRRLCHCLVEGGLLILTPVEGSETLCRPLVPLRLPGATVYRKANRGGAAPDETPFKEPAFFESGPPRFQVSEPLPVPEVEKAGEGLSALPPLELPPAETVKSGTVSEEKPLPPPDPYGEALAAYEKGLHDIAETGITKLLADRPDSAAGLALLARIKANRGQLAEARELCVAAIAAEKLHPGFHYLLGMIQQELGSAEESTASFKRAIYLEQNFVLAHFALGTVARRQGVSREAARHFANARAALRNYRRDDMLPESEGVTAGRMEEIIINLQQQPI